MLQALYTRSNTAANISQCPSNSPHRNYHKIRIFKQKVHVCELAPKRLNRHQGCQLTDTDLMRSSITLSVILVNLNRGCHLSDKPACRSVTGAESSQVKGTVLLCRYKYHTTKTNMHLKKSNN